MTALSADQGRFRTPCGALGRTGSRRGRLRPYLRLARIERPIGWRASAPALLVVGGPWLAVAAGRRQSLAFRALSRRRRRHARRRLDL